MSRETQSVGPAAAVHVSLGKISGGRRYMIGRTVEERLGGFSKVLAVCTLDFRMIR